MIHQISKVKTHIMFITQVLFKFVVELNALG
jgi:hypothetical protein